MADVNDSSGLDRAQLILVSGLMIAVTLLVLVLLLNTVIYTENVATRGIDSDVSDAVDFQGTIDEEIAKLLAVEHSEFDESDDWSELNESVTHSATILFDQQSHSAIQRGHLADATVQHSVRGIEIDAEGNGTIANNVNHSRDFDITVDSLNEAPSNVTVDATTFTIYETESGGNISVDDTEICSFDSPEAVTISFANGTVVADGTVTQCEELTEEFETSLDGGATIEIEEHEDIIPAVYFIGSTDSAGSPSFDHDWIIYELQVEITYQSSELEYSTVRTISEDTS